MSRECGTIPYSNKARNNFDKITWKRPEGRMPLKERPLDKDVLKFLERFKEHLVKTDEQGQHQ